MTWNGFRLFVRKPKSVSKICLVRWPALLETRASRLPIRAPRASEHVLNLAGRTRYRYAMCTK